MPARSKLTLLAGGITAALLFLIFTDAWPYLRGPAPTTAEWAWPFGWQPLARWWPSAVAAALFWLMATLWGGRAQPRPALFLPLLMVGHFALQISLVYAAHPHPTTELIARTYSKQTAGYFADTLEAVEQTGLGAFLATYPAQMPHFPSEHMRTHPPGLPLLNWVAVELMARLPRTAAWLAPTVWHGRCTDLWLVDRPPSVAAGLWLMAWMPLLIATLTLPLAYTVARRLLPPTHEPAARLAAVLTATIPALLLFAPITDQLFVPLTLLATWLLIHAEANPQRPWHMVPALFGSGLVLSALTWLSLGNAALALPLGLWLVWAWWGRGLPLRVWLGGGCTAVAGGLSLWLIYWLGWGVPPWVIVQEGLHQHYELVTRLRRYDWWLVWNLLDLALFSGWVWLLALLPRWQPETKDKGTEATMVIGSFFSTQGRKDAGDAGEKETLSSPCAPAPLRQKQAKNLSERVLIQTPTGRLLYAALALFILLNLSGSTRGEVGRLWLMGMPLLVVGAAPLLAQRVARPMATLCAIHLALALALGWAWRPVEPVVVVAQRPSMLPLAAPQPRPYQLADGLFLEAFSLETTAETLTVGLAWRTDQLVARPYTVFNHLVSETGELVAQADGWPGQGQWPPTCWAVGEQVSDTFVIHTAAIPPGTYRLYTGLYDARDGTRPRPPLLLEELVVEVGLAP